MSAPNSPSNPSQAGSDNSLIEEAQKAHEEGKGPSVGTTLVQPNGAQLQEVRKAEGRESARDWVGVLRWFSVDWPRLGEGSGRGLVKHDAAAVPPTDHVALI